jgi:hypothetical protein
MDSEMAQGRSFDDVCHALADRQRRALLFALRDRNPRPAEPVGGPTRGAADGDDRELEIKLYHVHLPKLHDDGFVEWDREAEEVRRGARFAEIEPLLDLLDDHRDELPWDLR